MRFFNRALVISTLIHAGLFGIGLGWMAWRAHAEGVEIDLGSSSLLTRLANASGQRAQRPPAEWFLSNGRRAAPLPVPVTQTAVPDESEAAGPPCPPPCPMNEGDWAPAGAAAKAPRWDVNISEDDYPSAARNANIQGKTIVEVKIDVDGRVRDVRLLKGSNALLDAKTMEKMREARFSPCRDAAGTPFPCKVVQPVGWVLE